MGIIPKAKKPLSSLTVHERDQEVSRLRHENEELIDEMGQRSDLKAKSTVQRFVKEQEEEENAQKQQDIEKLNLLTKNRVEYQRYLVAVLARFIKDEQIPKKYSLFVDSSDAGIAIGIEGTSLVRGFALCGVPFYDIHACKILAVQVGNTVAKLEGYVKQTDSGIILPDAIDKKAYGKK